MANLEGLLQQVADELKVSRMGVTVYHAALNAGAQGGKIEERMLTTEKKLSAVARRLDAIQTAVKTENLGMAQVLLTEEVNIDSP